MSSADKRRFDVRRKVVIMPLHDSRLRRALRAAGAGAAVLALLAACGGSSGGGSGGSGGSSVDPTPSGSVALDEDLLRSVLLTGDDIGGDFEDDPLSDGSAPLPCADSGDGTLDEQAPPGLQAGTLIASASLDAQVVEELKVYTDETAASAALTIVIDGFACATGSLYSTDGSSVDISLSGPSDITADVGVTQVDGVAAWEISSTTIGGLAVVSQFGASLVFMTLVSLAGSDPADLPDTLQVIQAALTKIVTS